MAQQARHSIQARRLAQVKRTLVPLLPQAQAAILAPSPQNSQAKWKSQAASTMDGMRTSTSKKARILCLHGYENSASILKKQLAMAGWLKELENKCEFVFLSGPFDSKPPGKSTQQAYNRIQ